MTTELATAEDQFWADALVRTLKTLLQMEPGLVGERLTMTQLFKLLFPIAASPATLQVDLGVYRVYRWKWTTPAALGTHIAELRIWAGLMEHFGARREIAWNAERSGELKFIKFGKCPR